MKIIATLTLLFSLNVDSHFSKEDFKKRDAVMLEVQKVTSHVTKNNPDLTPKQARKISSVILRKVDKHKIPKQIFIAILAQESMYKLSAKNCSSGKCTDLGISQIHIGTIKRYKFDKKRLLTDLDYSVEAGCIVLKDFMIRYGKKEKNWYSRYNSSNPIARKKYEKSIKRFL